MTKPTPSVSSPTANDLLLKEIKGLAHDLCTPRKIVAVAYVVGDALLSYLGFSGGSSSSGYGALISLGANAFLFVFVGGNILILGSAATLFAARMVLGRLQNLWAAEKPQFKGILKPIYIEKLMQLAKPKENGYARAFNAFGEVGFAIAGLMIAKGGVSFLLSGLSDLSSARDMSNGLASLSNIVLGGAFANYGLRFALGSAAMLPANWISHPTPYSFEQAWRMHGKPALREGAQFPIRIAGYTMRHALRRNNKVEGLLREKIVRDAKILGSHFWNFMYHSDWREHGKQHLLKGSNGFIYAGLAYVLLSGFAVVKGVAATLWSKAAIATTVGIIYRQGDHLMRHNANERITAIWARERKKRRRQLARNPHLKKKFLVRLRRTTRTRLLKVKRKYGRPRTQQRPSP